MSQYVLFILSNWSHLTRLSLPMDSKRVRLGALLTSVSGAAGRMSEVLSPWEEISGLGVTSCG